MQTKIAIIAIVVGIIASFSASYVYQSEIVINPNTPNYPDKLEKPIAQIEISEKIIVGKESMITGDSSYDPDGSITEWKWFVDDTEQGQKPFLLYTFLDTNHHAIKLVVTDDDSQESSLVQVVIAEDSIKPNPRDPSLNDNPPQPELDVPELIKYGPLVYKSSFDSPFNQFKDQSDYFYLDDFESGGLSVNGVTVNYGHVISPGEDTDSVDNDGDGLNDGFGRKGFSYWSDQGNNSLTFTFDKNILKNNQYPNYIGIVLTDSHYGNEIILDVYDENGQSIEKIKGKRINNSNDGRTDDDRFYGLYFEDGIKGFNIGSDSTSSSVWIEVDHLQFGFYNPSQ